MQEPLNNEFLFYIKPAGTEIMKRSKITLLLCYVLLCLASKKPLNSPNTLSTPVLVGGGMPRPNVTNMRFKLKIDLELYQP